MAKYDNIDFTPPAGVRAEAQKGLDWRREFGRGGTAVGVARARDLSNGTTISPDTARRMKAYFDRHEVDKQGEGWSPDQNGFPSNGRIAWALWGGDSGYSWSKKLVRQMNAADEGARSETMGIERRDVPLPLSVETRDDGKVMIRGMAACYGVRSVDLGGFTEEIRPGAFDGVMKADGRSVVGLFNHDSNIVLGTERAGTLRLAAMDNGLGYEIDPPATRGDVLELIRRGDVYGSSFAFTTQDDEWTTDENGGHLRYIRSIEGLYDVGPVLTPAYRDTSVAVRSLEKHLTTHRPALKLPALKRDAKAEHEIRRFLRQHGHKIG